MPKKENFSHISVRNRTVRPRGWPNQVGSPGAAAEACCAPGTRQPQSLCEKALMCPSA
jgi:hypothetical protein